jgi:hypothetical protein
MSAPLIVGVDPATLTGLCWGRVGETPRLESRKFRVSPLDKVEDLFGRAASFWGDMLARVEPDIAAIEAPVRVLVTSNEDTTTLTRGLYAIFAGLARARSIRVLPAQISTWRKYFLGHGRLAGAVAKRECLRRCTLMGWTAPDHNAAEAAGIWLWACAMEHPQLAKRPEPLFVEGVAS